MIIKALQAYFLHANLKIESTAALALGVLFAQPERFAGKKVCCIVSGGNVDPEVYSKALEEAIEGRGLSLPLCASCNQVE